MSSILSKVLVVISVSVVSIALSSWEDKNTSSTTNEVPQRIFDSTTMKLSVVDDVGIEGAYASSKFSKGICVIKIRKDIYPKCITHEVMHCLSLNWHPGRSTDSFCNPNNL